MCTCSKKDKQHPRLCEEKCCQKIKEVITLYFALVRSHLGYMFSSRLLSVRTVWTCCSNSSKGPQRCLRDWNIFHMRRGWGICVCLALNREGSGRILFMGLNVWIKKTVRHSQQCNRHKFNYRKFCLNINLLFYSKGSQTQEQAAQLCCVVIEYLWRYLKPDQTLSKLL